jgi:hypothetical protein
VHWSVLESQHINPGNFLFPSGTQETWRITHMRCQSRYRFSKFDDRHIQAPYFILSIVGGIKYGESVKCCIITSSVFGL